MPTSETSHSNANIRHRYRERTTASGFRSSSNQSVKTDRSRQLDISMLTQGLGWFSVALGTAELLFPRGVTNASGVARPHSGLTRLFGARELASGIGILTSRGQAQAPWIKARVAGDALDLAALGLALLAPRNRRSLTLLSILAVAGVTALDVLASQELQRQRTSRADRFTFGVPIETTLLVNQTPQACYDFWRKLENLPTFMHHLESVKVADDGTSHWVSKAPLGTHVEWDAEITDDRPGALLSWKSLPGSQIHNSGTVRFEEYVGGRGTLLVVNLVYDAPGGPMGAALARVLGEEPKVQIRDDLRRFKQLIETGEIPTTRGQPAGRRSRLSRLFGKGETP